jgi:predicted DNA-binding protein (MmcQ/YjbR family)
MFALVQLGPGPGSISLKCDPDLAATLRARSAQRTDAQMMR